MSIMVEKQECIDAINKFLKTKNLNDAVILFDYLCDIKGFSNHDGVQQMHDNPMILQLYINEVISQLMDTHKLISITDKNNILITVF